MPTLEILSGKHSGRTFTFTEEAKVGKDESCLIRLSDPGVSRYHAHIRNAGGAIQIEDLGSSNGTYVNFKKRPKGDVATLNDKDIIFFGRTVSKFWMEAPPETGSGGGGVSIALIRETVPIRGLCCPSCNANIEQQLAGKIREAEQVEVIRRLRLHEVDPATLDSLISRAR